MPGIQGQAGFAAGLFQERGAVPVVFGGDLREQEAAASCHGDEQAVTADFDGFGGNGLWGRQEAEFDF